MKARQDITQLDSRNGFALMAALGVLTLLSVLVVTVFANSMASFRSGMTDLNKSRAYYAAEAGAESAMAQLALALKDGNLTDAELAAITPPSIPGFSFDSFTVEKRGYLESEMITDGAYAGLMSRTQMVEITSVAMAPDYTSSAIRLTAKAQAIPIFQFGVFYEKDLEISNLPPMDFGGWIHSNGSIWTCSANAYYHDLITTPNKYYMDYKFQTCFFNGVEIDDASANGVNVQFDSRSHTDPNDFRSRSNADFDSRLMTDAFDVDSLKVPLPDGVETLEIIMPREASDTPIEIETKYAWKADWYIEVDLGAIASASSGKGKGKGKGKGTGPGSICDDGITHTRDSGAKAPKDNECDDIFFFGTDLFYEGRELRYVDVVDIDIGELQNWATGKGKGKGKGKGDPTSIVYITVDGTGGEDVAGDGVYPVIRILNAASLTDPITLATNNPLYVQGNYNTGVWQPSTLSADAVTFLSTNWDDAQHQTTTVDRGDWPAGTTGVNVALLAGHSPTPCDHVDCGTQLYGGGLENFPRFLEDWNGFALNYVGSLVSLFYNQQGVGAWKFDANPGNTAGEYYWPPTRNWSFDTRFEDPANLPPGTPVVGNVIHTAFRPLY